LGVFSDNWRLYGDVVLSVPASSNAEAYDKLDRMDTLKLLQLAVEQCEFSESERATKH